MSRKDYIAAAEIIHGTEDLEERARLAREFGRLFKADNPRFDKYRFETACGVLT